MSSQGLMALSPQMKILLVASLLLLGFAARYLLGILRERGIAKQLKEGPESRYEKLEGLQIHYLRIGKGPHMVLLHGIGASTFSWRYLIPLLASEFTLTIVDLPGFGRSSKRPDRDHGLDEQSRILTEFLERIGVDKATLVGSSMGGAIALWMAKLQPKRFPNVVGIAPAVSSRLMPLRLHWFAKFLMGPSNLLISRTFVKKIMKRVSSKHHLHSDEAVSQYQRPYIEDPNAVKTFVRATAVLSDPRLPDELKDLKSRTLILYGANDKMVPKSVMDELRQVLPHATYMEHEDAGHHPMEDYPEWVQRCLVLFSNHKASEKDFRT